MLGLFGGTFNPVHLGHIALAREVAAAFDLQGVEMIPSFISVHRDDPQVDPRQRLRMLELATADFPELRVNDCEIQRGGGSYTVDTLRDTKAKDPDGVLCWLMGVDAFNAFSSWKQPEQILQLAHLIVCQRPGASLDAQHYGAHLLGSDEHLQDFEAGKIAVFDMQPNACSSTEIRHQLRAGQAPDRCLCAPVLEFIHKHDLYEN